jgi:hypothetical protein
MTENHALLEIVKQRIRFWRDQLQTAYRSGDTQLAAECTRHLEEYIALTALASQQSATLLGAAGNLQTGGAENERQMK